MLNNHILICILWLLEGIIVGFGAIMPGISGGTLCVAFGMYKPLINILSEPRINIKKYWKMLGIFIIGGAIGFIGLSGLASWLMDKDSRAVTCAFIGFIIGTIPELWSDAGKEPRRSSSYFALILSFLAMLCLLFFLRSQYSLVIKANIVGYLFCGLLWGISFVVPGLSSSTLLLFFGLYEPMLDGISSLSLNVLLPLGFGVAICLIVLPKAVNAAYKRFYSIISHSILGIVLATTIMIIPSFDTSISKIVLYVVCILGGAILSFFLSALCQRLKASSDK